MSSLECTRPEGLRQLDLEVDLEAGFIDPKELHDLVDRWLILAVLEYWQGHRGRAATALGRSRRWLWLRIRELGIEERVEEIDQDAVLRGGTKR